MLAGDRGSAPFHLDKGNAAPARHLDRQLSGRSAGCRGGARQSGRSYYESASRGAATGLAEFPVSQYGRRCHGSTHPPVVSVGGLHLPARRHGVHEDSSWCATCSLRSSSKQYLVGAHRRSLQHELRTLIPIAADLIAHTHSIVLAERVAKVTELIGASSGEIVTRSSNSRSEWSNALRSDVFCPGIGDHGQPVCWSGCSMASLRSSEVGGFLRSRIPVRSLSDVQRSAPPCHLLPQATATLIDPLHQANRNWPPEPHGVAPGTSPFIAGRRELASCAFIVRSSASFGSLGGGRPGGGRFVKGKVFTQSTA